MIWLDQLASQSSFCEQITSAHDIYNTELAISKCVSECVLFSRALGGFPSGKTYPF